MLTHKPGLFLQRYGSYLSEEHLAYFDEIREENYEVDFYLKEARQTQCRFVKGQVVRNRRYRAMQDMIRWADLATLVSTLPKTPAEWCSWIQIRKNILEPDFTFACFDGFSFCLRKQQWCGSGSARSVGMFLGLIDPDLGLSIITQK